MKKVMLGWMLAAGISAMAGTVGPPVETIALPLVEQDVEYLVCVWDEEADDWLQPHLPYDNTGAYDFSVPVLGGWYWIGLWDSTAQQYVFGKWVGHFKTDG